MLRKVSPVAPMVVLVTVSAVPVVVVSVLTMEVCSGDADGAAAGGDEGRFAPVLTARPPVKVIVEPVLLVSRMPAPVSVIAPLKVARAAGAAGHFDGVALPRW